MGQTPLSPFIGDKTPRILIVDDQPLNLQVLAGHLMRWGCIVRTATDGAQAIAAANTFDPDLILLDIIMPGQSGCEVCESLQADPATRHIPIIFLTALREDDARAKGLDPEAGRYIAKPYESTALAAHVGSALREKYEEDLRGAHGHEFRDTISAHSKASSR